MAHGLRVAVVTAARCSRSRRDAATFQAAWCGRMVALCDDAPGAGVRADFCRGKKRGEEGGVPVDSGGRKCDVVPPRKISLPFWCLPPHSFPILVEDGHTH